MTAARVVTRIVLPLIGAGIALALLFLLYGDLDLDRLLDALASARPVWLAVLAAAILGEQLLRAWKWRQILFDRKPVPVRRLFGAIMAGYAAGILVPLGISPLVRSWLVARIEGISLACVLVTAMIERLVDGIVFALFAFAAASAAPAAVDGLAGGLAIAGGINLLVFGGILSLLFQSHAPLGRDASWPSRVLDAIAARGGKPLAQLRDGLRDGIVWPRSALRQAGIIAASAAMKFVAASHLIWAGLALGIGLSLVDGILVMVIAGIAMILGRLIRIPGGFVIGAGFALHSIGLPDAAALAMILLVNVFSIALTLALGFGFLSRIGLDLRAAARETASHGPGARRQTADRIKNP